MLPASAQKPHSEEEAWRHCVHVQSFPAADARAKSGQVPLAPNSAVPGRLTSGEWVSTAKKTALSMARQTTMPARLSSMSRRLPALSTKNMLTTEPKALSPDVTRDSASAVLLDANPASCTMVGL